jgi:hypothetical protein
MKNSEAVVNKRCLQGAQMASGNKAEASKQAHVYKAFWSATG